MGVQTVERETGPKSLMERLKRGQELDGSLTESVCLVLFGLKYVLLMEEAHPLL